MTDRSVLATADFSPLAVAGRPDAFTTIRDGSSTEYNIFQGLFRPGDKNWLYLAAVESGDGNPHLLVSSDAGASWTVRDWPSDVGSGTFWRMDQTGATGLIGQANFAVAADGRMFVVANDINFDTSDALSSLNGLYVSDDDGATWTKIIDPPAPSPQSGYSVSQGPYGGFMGVWVGDTSLWASACYGYGEVDSGPTNMISNDGELRALRYALSDYSLVSDELVWRPETTAESAVAYDLDISDSFTRADADSLGDTESPVLPWQQYGRNFGENVQYVIRNNHALEGRLGNPQSYNSVLAALAIPGAVTDMTVSVRNPQNVDVAGHVPAGVPTGAGGWPASIGDDCGTPNPNDLVFPSFMCPTFWGNGPYSFWVVLVVSSSVVGDVLKADMQPAYVDFSGAHFPAAAVQVYPVADQKIRVETVGDTINAYIDSTLVGSWDRTLLDTVYPKGSQCGMTPETLGTACAIASTDLFEASLHVEPLTTLTAQRRDYGKQLTGVRGQDTPVWVCKETKNQNPDSSTDPPRAWRLT